MIKTWERVWFHFAAGVAVGHLLDYIYSLWGKL